MINLTCWKCAEPMEAPDSLIGQVLECPKCNSKNTIKKPKRKEYHSPIARYIVGGIFCGLGVLGVLNESLAATPAIIFGMLLIIWASIAKWNISIIEEIRKGPEN